MRALPLLALLAWSAWAEAGLLDRVDWHDLWQTPDQRGEQLLKQGKPGMAAGVFRDPRRKAYAELLAGDYGHAARDFAPFDDSDSLYNRGNALARAGDLQGALKAYDAALARNPDNRDARHNRDLVAEALKHPPPKQPSSASGGKQGGQPQNGNKQSQSGGSQQPTGGQSGRSGDQGKTGQNGKANGASNNGQGQAGQAKTGAAQANAGPERNRPGSGQEQSTPSQVAQNGQAGQQASPNRPGPDSAAAALADAEAALHGQPNGKAVADTPLSERQLAQQDWLRRIPDDPGGLLRRKFLIEHMLRQQGGQP